MNATRGQATRTYPTGTSKVHKAAFAKMTAEQAEAILDRVDELERTGPYVYYGRMFTEAIAEAKS